jgi:3-oxoacyl-[acyl-carrier protein] reductase
MHGITSRQGSALPSDATQQLPSELARPFRLAGRRALVTAGSSGIGRATALALRAHGADVFITGTSERTAEVANEIDATGHAIADFTQPGQAAGAVAEATDALGGLDILFANTGGPKPADFGSLTDADWLAAYHLILGSAIELTHAALPAMAETGGGRVIYLTSVAGVVRPLAGLHLSNVMRAGVAALAASLVSEYGPRGITFNVIAPGPIDTPRRRQIMSFQAQRRGFDLDTLEADELDGVPVRRFGRADEIGALVVYLASEAAGFVTGRVHVIDGGVTAV